jgi:DNA polymerase III epsilon subunit-like protein
MYLIIDTETTGLPITEGFNKYYHYTDDAKYDGARLVQISWQILDADLAEVAFRNYIIKRDGFDIKNSTFHKITNKISDDRGVPIGAALEALEKDLEICDTVVAHNIVFDYHVILNHCHRYGYHRLEKRLLDKQLYCTATKSKKLLKIAMPYGGYKMPALCELYSFFFKKELENAHDAFWDTKACSECFVQLKALGK